MRLGAGLGLAFGSTLALNWGWFAQHGAASSLPALRWRRPAHSLGLLFRDRRWLAGFLVGIGGWALYVTALAFAPLSLVQAVSAGGIGVLAVLVHVAPGGDRLRPRQWQAVAIAFAGMLLLGISLAGSHSSGTPTAGVAGVAIGGGALAACLLALVQPGAAGFGAAAGIFYAAGDVATKAAVAGAGAGFVPVVFASHGLAFLCLQLGFQRGNALASAGVATVLTNALPIAAGTALFHEPLPHGALGDCRLAAFVLVTVSAAALVRP